MVNWLLYYRERLFGRTHDELQQQKKAEQQQSNQESSQLPSVKMFEQFRVD